MTAMAGAGDVFQLQCTSQTLCHANPEPSLIENNSKK